MRKGALDCPLCRPSHLRTRSSFVNHAHGGSMNKFACTLVAASVLVSGSVVFGQNTTKTSPDKHAKKQISDNQMDKVTAAGEESSSIAADGSSVTTNGNSTVNLSGSALSSASGVNIVSSSDALVGGGGVNVYSASGDSTKVKQSNSVDQSEATQGTLTDYHRGQNSQLAVTASSNVTKSNAFTSSLNTSLNTSTTDAKSYSNDTSNAFSTMDSRTSTRSAAQSASGAKSAS